jgi:hypothetical protein
MDGPPNTTLPKLTASNERMKGGVVAGLARRGAVTAGRSDVVESAPRRQPPKPVAPPPPPTPKATTLGALAEALDTPVIESQDFNPSKFLKGHTPAVNRSGAGLAGAALGRMFKRR